MDLVIRVIVSVFVVWATLGVVTVGMLNSAKLLVRSSARSTERASLQKAHGVVDCGQVTPDVAPALPRVLLGVTGTWRDSDSSKAG